jgi:hypothetical protein
MYLRTRKKLMKVLEGFVGCSEKRRHRLTPHSRIGLTPSVADVGSGKRLLRQLPTGVRECEKRYPKDLQTQK